MKKRKSALVGLSLQKKKDRPWKTAQCLLVWVVARGRFPEKEQNDRNHHVFIKECFESSSRSFPAFWGLGYWKDKVFGVPCWCLLSLMFSSLCHVAITKLCCCCGCIFSVPVLLRHCVTFKCGLGPHFLLLWSVHFHHLCSWHQEKALEKKTPFLSFHSNT